LTEKSKDLSGTTTEAVSDVTRVQIK